MSAVDKTPANSKIIFRNPNFQIHKSVLRFVLPLSKFAKLPSNKDKTLLVGVIILHPDTFTPASTGPPRLLVLAKGDGRYELPSGKVIFGTDQTLLESVVRTVREVIGQRVTAIVKSIEGEEWETSGSKFSATQEGKEQDKERFKRYSFLVKVDWEGPAVKGDIQLAEERYNSYQWITREEVAGLTMADEMRQTVIKALDFVEFVVRVGAGEPET